MAYYDKAGSPIDLYEFSRLYSQEGYQRVAGTHVAGYDVSTVWLGIDHGFGRTPQPILFETMVFGTLDGEHTAADEYQMRYRTEDEARSGHAAIVSALETYPDIDIHGLDVAVSLADQ